MEDRKQALAMARVNRLCPPPRVKKDPGQEDELKQHLLVCPYCNEKQGEDVALWDEFAKTLGDVLFPADDKPPVTAGRFFYLKKTLACWRNQYFYNPPMVLVIDAASVASDDILVAQAYHDTRLAGPGDLVLSEEHGITGALFVETWNVYTLRASDLGPALDVVSTDIVNAVKKMETTQEFHPSWAYMPAPFDTHDPRLYFREMEIEVGYIFSHRAVDALMEGVLPDTPIASPILSYESLADLEKDLKRRDMVLDGTDSAATPEELLAVARFSTTSLAMAAASGTGIDETGQQPAGNIVAKLVYLKSGRIMEIKPVICQIIARDLTSEGIVLSGTVTDLPVDLPVYRLYCIFRQRDGNLVRASQIDLDAENGWFLAAIKGIDSLAGDTLITILAAAD